MNDVPLLGSLGRMGSALAWTLFGLAAGCGDDVRVGSNYPVHDGGQGVNESGPESCVATEDLSAVPTQEIYYATSPALFVETARGVFSNANGDTFSAQIAYATKRVEDSCVDDPSLPAASDLSPNPPSAIPDGAELPYVTFDLQAQIAFHTADGAWDEHFDTTLLLTPHREGNNGALGLSGSTELALADSRRHVHAAGRGPGDDRWGERESHPQLHRRRLVPRPHHLRARQCPRG
ncbi:MAG: hypothetical protein QM778_04900 [Myxococcales bacterium]